MQGTVKKITEKASNGKVYFGLVLEDNDNLYRCGTNKPNCSVGSWVEFEVSETKWGPFVKDNTLQVSSGKATTSAPSLSYSDKDTYWSRKELRDIETQKKISYNGAYNSAVNFVELALANGALTLGSGKASAKFEVLKEVVEKVASENYKLFQTKYLELESEMFNDAEKYADPLATREETWPTNQE